MMPDRDLFLFVSHVSEDRPAALDIVDELERRGIPCWIAPRDVHPGKPFDDEIAEAIEASRAMLLIFSEHCNENDYIRREITVAGESHKVIIPFRIEDAQPRLGLRVRLSDLHWIDGFMSRERAIDQVVRTIDPDWTRQEQERRRAEERQRAHEQRRQQEAEEEQSRLRAEKQRREQPPEKRPLLEWMVEVRSRMQQALGRRSIAIASAAAVAVVALVIVHGSNQKKYIYVGIPDFFENFTSFKLNSIWVASLPNAIWRSQPGAGIAHFAGSPHYSFERLSGSSVLRLTNILNNAQRVGLSTSETFAANRPIRYEIRFNTLTISPSTSIDQFIEIWLIDAEDYSRYDKVALSAPGYGKDRVFTADSSISNTGVDTEGVNVDFTFSSNNWYRLVLEGSPNQDVTAILYDDSGKSMLMRADLQHTLAAFPVSFRIGLSQSMGLPGGPRPTDVAIDWVKLQVE